MYIPQNCLYSKRLIDKLVHFDTSKKLDFQVIGKALDWTIKYHGSQIRKSGHPFYSHPIEVAYKLADYCIDTNMIVSALFHDIVEDTEVTTQMIEQHFNKRISVIVDRLTRDRPGGKKLSVEEIIQNAYKLDDKDAILIKILDRIHNLETLIFMKEHKRAKTAIETLENIIGYCPYEEIMHSLIINSVEYLCSSDEVDDIKRLCQKIFSFHHRGKKKNKITTKK